VPLPFLDRQGKSSPNRDVETAVRHHFGARTRGAATTFAALVWW